MNLQNQLITGSLANCIKFKLIHDNKKWVYNRQEMICNRKGRMTWSTLITGPGIEPGTPATIVRGSTTELIRPISGLYSPNYYTYIYLSVWVLVFHNNFWVNGNRNVIETLGMAVKDGQGARSDG